jgi:hypothetical protein
MSTNVGAKITSVRTVAVPVSEPERPIGSYCGTLGFDKRMERRSARGCAGSRWHRLGRPPRLRLRRPGDTQPGRDTGIRLSTGDAASEHSRLQSAGGRLHAEVSQLPGVPPMFSFRDPDRNQLYCVQDA